MKGFNPSLDEITGSDWWQGFLKAEREFKEMTSSMRWLAIDSEINLRYYYNSWNESTKGYHDYFILQKVRGNT